MTHLSALAMLLASTLATPSAFAGEPDRIPDPTYVARQGDRAVLGNFLDSGRFWYQADCSDSDRGYWLRWKLANAQEHDEVQDLRDLGRVFDVPVGTPVEVIEIETFDDDDPRRDCAVVKILAGDRKGQTVWVELASVGRPVANPRAVYAVKTPLKRPSNSFHCIAFYSKDK